MPLTPNGSYLGKEFLWKIILLTIQKQSKTEIWTKVEISKNLEISRLQSIENYEFQWTQRKQWVEHISTKWRYVQHLLALFMIEVKSNICCPEGLHDKAIKAILDLQNHGFRKMYDRDSYTCLLRFCKYHIEYLKHNGLKSIYKIKQI